MIAGLKPYAEMKDSGVSWLGEVPERWNVQRIKTLFRERDERSRDGVGLLLSLTRARGLLPQSEASNRLASASDLSKYKVCRPGDLVMNRMQAWSGMFAASEVEGLVSPDYSVFAAIEPCEIKYFEHLFKTPAVVDQFAQASKGIGSGFNRLYTPEFGAVPVVVPPLTEQAAIVRFLDHAEGRIRRAIAAKQKLIRLLEEQKQAIIHRAVTRGLDPDVRLKPSGVEWLGDVPGHWEIERLSHVAHFRSGKAHEQHVDEAGEYVCVNARFVSTNGRSFKRCTENLTPARKGDVLMVMSDLPNGRALARAFFTPEDSLYAVNQRVCALTAYGVDPKFLSYYANRNVQLLRHDDGSNQTHLSNYDFKTMRVLIPPASEQHEIVKELDKYVHENAEMSERLVREIALLREYRTRLIADIVTGKHDVREAAARLPESPEPELGDDEALDTEGDDDASLDEAIAEDAAA